MIILSPGAVLFDLAMGQPDFALPLLREQPNLPLIGVHPSSDQMLVFSSQSEQSISMADLIKVIRPEAINSR